MIILIGNGQSKSITDLNLFKNHITYGCDSIYRKFMPNYLICQDMNVQLELITNNLTKKHSILKLQTHENKQHFESPTIRFEEVNKLLQEIVLVASKASGFSINKPEIITNNKNWIIGTSQNFKIYFDLREIPKIPGLKLNIVINGISNKNNFKTKPLEPTFNQGLTSFPLEIGQINQLEVSNWEWNQISVGVIFIIALTLLSLSLQRLRLQMGFGFPELPP